MYGDNDSRTPVETIDRKWEELLKEVTKVEARGEHLIIVGDQNKHLNINDNGKKDSHGGKLIKDLVNSGEYILVNETDKTVGGPNTRYAPEDPDDEERNSMLDLAIMSKDVFKYVVRLEID